jgi:hypothetical protein
MNTYRIFEELSATLGDQAARAVVHAIENVYEELQKSASKSDFAELKQALHELAEAQKRTEKRVEELAEAQKRTEESVRRLSDDLRVTRQELGNLSHTVGYQLENQAYKALPELLLHDFGITVKGRLKRGYLPDRKVSGKMIEVNILGEGLRSDGSTVRIIGESKTQLSRKKVDAYIDRVVPRIDVGDAQSLVVLVAHMESEPNVAEHARDRDCACYFSFDF